jgi:hypothetical protein
MTPPPPTTTTKTKMITTTTNNNSNKKLKYESLCIDIQRMWNLECMIIPVIIGATRLATKCLRKYLEIIPGKHSVDSLQKTPVLGTSLIIQKCCSLKLEA